MKKRSLSCIAVALSLILTLGSLAACGGNGESGSGNGEGGGNGQKPPVTDPTGPETPTVKNYTVTFDVGEEARAAGVTTPASQTVMSGYTAVEPTIDYWEGHELDGWYSGSNAWNFTTDKVTANTTLTAKWNVTDAANIAEVYEKNLTWGEIGHLYVHYLRGADDENEHGLINPSPAPDYNDPIDSDVYGDWGLWVWEYNPTPSEGRTFFPMQIDESGAVYDIDLTATWNDGGWDSGTRTHKNSTVSYSNSTWVGIQLFSQDSRLHGTGFWVNDGGDVYVQLSTAKRDKGDYHWFVRQGEAQDGTPTYESFIVFDPYEGLEPGSAITHYDVVSNQGNNNTYVQHDVAEGWEEDSVGYQIFMASFADSDGDGMGDIQGIISKLDYLEELGVDVLWLTPFQKSNSYHGYDIQDYFSVDPRFGTLADYRELVTKAHERGMKILLDFVLNHTSTSNPWFEKSTKLVTETIQLPDGRKKVIDYRNFYNWQNEEYVNSLTDPAAKNQWYKDANGYYFFSSFGSSMPELNFDYQAVRDAILEVALYWMSFGLDGFRLDAIKHIYMKNENPEHSNLIVNDVSDGSVIGSTAGDYSYDVKKDANFFLEFNAKLKASYPNALLVGENFNGDPIHIAQLYEGLDSQFNFNFYYDISGCLGTIAQGTQTQQAYNSQAMTRYAAAQFDFQLYRKDYIDGIFTSNHDVERARNRVLSRWNDKAADWVNAGVNTEADVELSGKLAKLWAGLCLTMPGITWIYEGDELGMFGTKTANPAGEGSGHEDRWLRQPFKWSKEKGDDPANCEYKIGFNNYTMTWDKNNMELDGYKEQTGDPSSIFNVYKNLIELRHTSQAFRSGRVRNLTSSKKGTGDYAVMVYEVTDGTDTFRVFVNATNETQIVSSNNRLTTNLRYSTSGSGMASSGSIPAFTFMVYQVY